MEMLAEQCEVDQFCEARLEFAADLDLFVMGEVGVGFALLDGFDRGHVLSSRVVEALTGRVLRPLGVLQPEC